MRRPYPGGPFPRSTLCFFRRGLLAVPLFGSGGDTVGVLELLTLDGGGPDGDGDGGPGRAFTEADEAVAKDFGAHIAAALEASLRQSRTRGQLREARVIGHVACRPPCHHAMCHGCIGTPWV